MSMCKDNYEVCFVQVTGKTLSKHLQQAFEEMHSKLMEPTWITKEECMAITEKQPKLFVMDPFEGEVYNHLNSVQCRIVGPLAILYCLENNDVLPKRPHPVYSVSMRKITVSCSNITNTLREDISMKTARMGGLFSKDLTRSVSHLVVGEVGSKKYQVAANFNLSIMTPDWIESVWNHGQYKLLHASHPSYEKFKCPVFKGLVITVSQLSVEERQSIQSLVEENGGRYLAPLKAHETTHLILSEPIGEKYRYAKNWKVFCVSTKWIFDSIETGYCKDENLYRVDFVQPKRSTPNRDLTACELPLVDCSAITNASTVTHLDETVKSELSFTVNRKNSIFSSLELFNMACLPKGGQFLDGCKIFLTGFSPIHLDKLRKIVNAGGGMRFSKYNESVSHVVCGSMDNEFLQNYKQSSIKPYVVSFDWLLECCKEQRMAEEKPFQCMDAAFLSPAKVEATEAKNISMTQKSQPKVDNPLHDDNITDIFQQYVCGDNTNGDKEMSEKSKYDSKDTSKENDSKLKSHSNTVVSSDAHPSEVINLEEVTESQQMFVGIKFTIIGFGEKDIDILSEIIRCSSGTVLPSDSAVTKDLAIVPIYWQDPVPYVSNIVTNCWLVKCFEDSRIYDFDENEFFKPVQIASGKKPFESLVLSVSQYAGIERDTLMLLAEKLGAICQEYFVRKANRSKCILPNTHLILLNPEGSKYEASKKWNIPAVTMKWVIDCAKTGVALPVSKYLVENLPHIELSNEEIPLCREEELKSKQSESLTKPLSQQSSQRKSKTINALEVSVVPDNNKKPTLDKYPDKEIDEEIHVKEFNNEGPSMSTPHQARTNLKCESRLGNTMSPIVRTREKSLNDTLNLDKSYKYKFQVSSLLNALESSAENSHLEKSLPIGDLFSKNLALARKVFNLSSLSQSDNSNLDEIYVKDALSKVPSDVLKGVILYVAKKLNNIQNDLNEIVSSLGGRYVLHFDSSCSHFVFSGKMNDLNKEFREARIQNKKIVCPEWLYACKEQQSHVNESLFPHTYKPNMSLSNEIAIVTNIPAENEYQIKNMQVNELVDNLQTDDKKADFNQELNDLLVAAKSAKKRLSKKQVNSITNSPSNQVSPMQKLQKQISTSFTKTIKHEENTDEPDTGSQSQGFPIVWDDPMGRMEREKIAAQAATVKVNNSPQQEISLSNKKSSNLIDENLNEKIEEITTKPNSPVIKKFMFSLIPEPKKEEYVEIIVRLGGEMSDENSFDMSATHLILQKPIKNEKLLSSVASGKWILHPEFLTACEKQGKFVSELEYEWGGPRTSEFFHNLPINSRKIAVCPFRWRNKIATHTYTNGAFHGWCVRVLVDDKNKRTTYSKILEAGGASIVSSSETISDKLTHVIVDVKRKLSQVDLQSYLASGAKCVKPEYLAFYLTEDPLPNVENFLIPEAKILFSDTSEAGFKRQSSCSMTTRLSKRSKHS